MTATIERAGGVATLAAGVWRSDDRALRRACEAASLMHERPAGDPNPDEREARFVADQVGGRLRSFTRPKRPRTVDH